MTMKYGQAIINVMVYSGIVVFGLWFWWVLATMAVRFF